MPRLIVVPVRIRETDYGELHVRWATVPGAFDLMIVRTPDGVIQPWAPYVYGSLRGR